MKIRGTKVLVTGGAGFIGSELCGRLLQLENEVVCFDNFSSGKEEFITPLLAKEGFSVVRGDMLKPGDIKKALEGCEIVFHLAANPDVRAGEKNTSLHFEQNVVATYNLLEAMKDSDARGLVFASSSVVYGSASVMPTPESYGPLLPISLYGASKLSCEALISAYSDNFWISSAVLRFANIIGKNAHGVTKDFIAKLNANPKELEILGDGTQSKSYLHLNDCLDAILFAAEKTEKIEAYNIGSEDKLNVRRIAEIICEEKGLRGVAFKFTGKQAWMGDVKLMLLSIEKMKRLGWKPKLNSEQAVRKAVKEILGKQ